ncbi:acetate--CoA ligase [candidate division TA06 bacterium B3_TA06]|uniref:acetate--CoA ligase n=1 Tax=candidate division TA06 bacterium B3_TA06 TaxID=2012487 RepID=A0A532VB73_UNCT6|nr:MAG: acetate--CoA ligase [candidate division TA06 bacterium B3_TA06]
MSNIGNYEERYKAFDWAEAQEHLGYKEGDFLNIGYYCSDRICDQGKADKLALIWEGSDGTVKKYTFNDIRVLSNTYAKFLKDSGIEKGDRVCIFMDRIPDLYISLLGILKIGAIAQPLFSAFGPESLITRLANAETKAVLTTRKHVSKVRKIKADLPALKHVIIVDGEPKKKVPGEIVFELEKAEPVEEFESFAADLETPSLLHYTSGTTGQPKGALHVHSAIFAQAITTRWVLDLNDSDIYWCTADPGWVTGTSYGIIGPWSLGITQVVLDAGFIPDRWYKFIADHKVTVWYSAPTAIRMLMKQGEEIVKKYDLSSLRYLASVGEPLNAEAVHWSRQAYGLPFNDNFWQTETGSIVISNYPGMEIKPGSMGRPFPGITATVLDLKTHEPITEPGKVGLIALRPGWPSMFRQYWRNPETYRSKFDKGWYICGDRASIDKDGYFWFVGRDDDVINTGGHLVGPFEIESALLEHPAVAESAAVGKPDEVNMEVVKAFVALKPGFEPSDDLELNIMNFIRKRLSPLAMPQEIEFVSSLPKTRSGKIMRRVLRAQEWGEEVGDLSTLEND